MVGGKPQTARKEHMQDTNIHIRASAEFKEQVRQQAADSGFTTVSQYIKYLVANDKKESNGKRK